jgi:predicted anti-sigma-YlaC factor YlaD
MNCKELVELVTDYLEDMLSSEERVRFEDHLTRCEGCRNYIEQMRMTIRLSGRLTEHSIVGKSGKELLTAFRDWKRGGR